MNIRIASSFLIAIVALTAMAQTETPDTVQSADKTAVFPVADYGRLFAVPLNNDSIYSIWNIKRTPVYHFPITHPFDLFGNSFVRNNSAVSYSPTIIRPGVIYNTGNMALRGAVNVVQYPGMMNKATGTLGTTVGNGKVNFYVGGIVNQYAFYGGLVRQFGVTGTFTYRISSPLSFSAFACYYGKNAMPMMPDGSLMPPSMLGYYDVSRFGGYADYRISERFGLQMGGQVVERMGTRGNHYEIEPIATPYINVGSGKKKVGIGLPVGQIIYGLFGR